MLNVNRVRRGAGWGSLVALSRRWALSKARSGGENRESKDDAADETLHVISPGKRRLKRSYLDVRAAITEAGGRNEGRDRIVGRLPHALHHLVRVTQDQSRLTRCC